MPQAVTVQHVPIGGDNGSELSSEATIFPNGLLITSQMPNRPDGSVDLGDIESQSRRTLENLRIVLEANGSSLADVAHLTIYLTDIASDRAVFNDVYEEVFRRPFPARCAIGIDALAIKGMKVEVTALAHAR